MLILNFINFYCCCWFYSSYYGTFAIIKVVLVVWLLKTSVRIVFDIFCSLFFFLFLLLDFFAVLREGKRLLWLCVFLLCWWTQNCKILYNFWCMCKTKLHDVCKSIVLMVWKKFLNFMIFFLQFLSRWIWDKYVWFWFCFLLNWENTLKIIWWMHIMYRKQYIIEKSLMF